MVASIATPFTVFLVSVWLASKRKISYGVMVTLLLFGLLMGFTVANYDILQRVVRSPGVITKNEAKALQEHLDKQFDKLNQRIGSAHFDPVSEFDFVEDSTQEREAG